MSTQDIKNSLFGSGSLKEIKIQETIFYIRSLSYIELKQFQEIVESDNVIGVMSKLLILSLVDKDGNRVLTDNDTESLQNIPIDTLRTIFDAAVQFNALAPSSEEKKS